MAMKPTTQDKALVFSAPRDALVKLQSSLGDPRRAITAVKSSLNDPQRALVEVQGRIKGIEMRFHSWLKAQPLAVEAAVTTAMEASQGAALGVLLGGQWSQCLTPDASSAFTAGQSGGLPWLDMAPLKQVQALAGSPLVQARNFALMTGANAGISCVMKRIRGVDDVQNSMVAAFGAGTLYSLVSGMGGMNPVAGAVSSGAAFAVVQGGMFMLGQKFSQRGQKSSEPQLPADHAFYSRGRSMLMTLGLQQYERNFKDGLLTDSTLPLLTDSALRDVRIPPGPRLVILDHVSRDPDITARK